MDRKKTAIWIVGALIVLGAAALLFLPKGDGVPAQGDVSNAELKALVAKGARLVDVRTPAEYEGGHIAGAVNVPVDTVAQASASWDKALPVVVYCQTGSRSLNAAGYLTGQGFSHVYNLPQGMAGWDGAVVRGSSSGEGTGQGTVYTGGKPAFYAFISDG